MDTILFLGLSLQAWATVATLMAVFVMLVRTHIAPEVILLGAVTILFLAGVVSEKEVLEGFGSEPVGVHAAFFVVAAGSGKHLCCIPQLSECGDAVYRHRQDMGA